MRLLKAVSSLCCVSVLALVVPGCGITLLGKGTDDDGDGGNGTTAGSGGSSGVGEGAGAGGSPGVGGGPGAGGGPEVCVPGIAATSQFPRLLNRQYDAVVRDLLGVATLARAGNSPPSALLVPDFEGSMTDVASNTYLAAAESIAAEVIAGPNKSRFIDCDPATSPTCFEDTIRTFGRKAFRRPLTEDEVQRYLRFTTLEPQGTPDEIAEAILYALLAAPSFIMRTELAQEREGNAIKLSSHEVAARLSFLLWDSVPDDALNAAADAGQLSTKAQILAQARRMIQVRDKTARALTAFHRHYTRIGEGSFWGARDHDTTKYPDYSPDAVLPMMAEMDAFFEEVAFEGGAFEDLFLSNVGFVNKDTARLYGLNPASYGTELTRVELAPSQRPGFLTRVAFLSSFSSYDATSPALRGGFIMGLLGIRLQPVPNGSDQPLPSGDFTTNRERVERLTSPAACAPCHETYLNPPGFVLERYDAVGKAQTIDPLGGPIDGTADVFFGADDIKTIETPLELMAELAAAPAAKRTYAERWVSFAAGRRPNSNDACVVDELDAKLSDDGYTILDLLTDLTQADSFRLRVVGD